MPARFDRKFIVILSVSAVIAAVVIGAALAVLQPWGPARHLRRAEAAAAEGDWVRAWSFYGRAFGKEPGNIAYLDLTRDALLEIVPQTSTEAMERYQTLLALLDRATRVGSANPERWQAFLEGAHDLELRGVQQPVGPHDVEPGRALSHDRHQREDHPPRLGLRLVLPENPDQREDRRV